MSAPLAKGILIAAGFVVAAGIALFQDEQFRIWFDERKRRLAVAIYDIRPGHATQMTEVVPGDAAYTRAMDIVQRNRLDLVRRAREEGIAVDLDELTSIRHDDRPQDSRRRSNTSFDDFLTEDGKFRNEKETAASSSAVEPESSNNVRHRNAARGLAAGSSFANPFDDETNIMFDQEERPTTPTPRSVISIPVTDEETSTPTQLKTDDELDAEIREAIRRSLLEAPSINPETHADLSGLDDSLYATSPFARPTIEHRTPSTMTQSYHPPPLNLDSQTEDGSATPRRGSQPSAPASVASSEISTDFESINTPSTMSPTFDTRSPTIQPEVTMAPVTAGDETDTFSDFHSLPSDDEIFETMSEAESEFSMISGNLTPTDWTDVDTDAEGEEHNGRVARPRPI